ncbi:MAG: hypothetical protein SAL07_25050 [Oscillatoria sp. PMC 1051.18]|nr:hypothetical protein [Oscillatoria sp. PMC 1050.18]MEC5033159.1 hypothetical protein [Oscillatoria sp. PMC 1051.18]MEC5033175.1 hypothetical protein [Oscillatoria sp. PMC 1051.18]
MNNQLISAIAVSLIFATSFTLGAASQENRNLRERTSPQLPETREVPGNRPSPVDLPLQNNQLPECFWIFCEPDPPENRELTNPTVDPQQPRELPERVNPQQPRNLPRR